LLHSVSQFFKNFFDQAKQWKFEVLIVKEVILQNVFAFAWTILDHLVCTTLSELAEKGFTVKM